VDITMTPFHPFGLAGQNSTETSKEILGGKGAGLIWMAANDFPVPPGFVVPTTVWAEYDKKPKTVMKEIAKLLPAYMGMLKAHYGYMPLVSVRSGSRDSMPGMMDTILNVGFMPYTVEYTWKDKLGAEGYETSLHRLITMYGSVVKGLDRKALESGTTMEALSLYGTKVGIFPNPEVQLLDSIEAVFKSWDNERAVDYRKKHNIPREWGTAVTVQAMVFGNLGDTSATGVLFSRNPDTGLPQVTGEWLENAQGEDVVAGIRTPKPLGEMASWNNHVACQLCQYAARMEKLCRDMQDIEFTVENGKLYLLQHRAGKRTIPATIRIALDMAKEGLLTFTEAARRVTPEVYDNARLPVLDPTFKKPAQFTGTAACSGIVTGVPVFSSQAAINCKVPCILVTNETTPDDYAGMLAAKGVITMNGGLTSHAAVVARGENVPCITGVGANVNDLMKLGKISMDGATGRIWLEEIPIIAGSSDPVIQSLLNEYESFVFSLLGAVPAIYDAPENNMDQAMLVLGHHMIDPVGAADLVIKAAKKVDRLYVDCSLGSGPEAEFFSICRSANVRQEVVRLLEMPSLDCAQLLQDRLVVLGDVITKFKTLGNGSDLRALILSAGEIMMVGESETTDLSDPAIAKVMGWKKAEGLTAVSVGMYKQGVKSIIPFGQALQLVGKG
jgi:phosphoenolpyruvate synthase/pyruvate phosphate dikinase